MKKLSKIMLSVAAASVVTAAMAVTAMAADTITGTYDNETGVVTMEGVIGSGASQTLLVLNNDAEDINSASIAYINQIDNSGTFSTFTLAAGLKPATASESVTYYIKVGGTDGTVQTGTLTIEATTPTVTTITIKFGNIDLDAKSRINLSDVIALQQYVAKINNTSNANVNTTYTVVSGLDEVETFKLGNIDLDAKSRINLSDVIALQQYVAKISNTSNANVGKSVEVVDDSAN